MTKVPAPIATGITCAALVLAAAAPTIAADELHLRLDWSWHAVQVPYLLAKEKGYYQEAGLDVTIEQGQGSKTTTVLVGEGASPVGHVNLSTAAQSIAAGVPITAIAGVAQQGPIGLICDATAGVDAPEDVKGKKIGSTPAGSDAQILPTFLARNGLQQSDVQIVNMQGDGKFAALMSGQVDCISGDIPYYAPQATEKGKEVTGLSYAEWGVPNLAYGLIVNNEFLKGNPDVVRRFVEASLRGVEYAYANPEESADFFMQETGNTQSREYNLSLLTYYVDAVHTENTQGKPLGWMAEADWQGMLEALGQAGAKPVGEYYTDEFIPGS
jgi:NitT/TauT family transport system substrate-binding protein